MACLYAVLVGINKYESYDIRELNGCEYDVDKMRVFLNNYTVANQLEFKLLALKNWDATRQNVVDSFQHFRSAQEDDICLFYFSGHGSQVDAPSELAHLQADGKLETIVCNDSRSTPEIGDLTDKELGHLIWEATSDENGDFKGNHFLAIFDSCHSGSITRNTKLTPRLQSGSGVLQPIERFYGYQDYLPTQEGLQPKSGPHVVLSASEAHQSAYEKPFQGIPRGVFTTALLSALENENLAARTYSQLINLVIAQLHQGVLGLQNPFYELRGWQDEQSIFLFGRADHRVFRHYLFYDHNQQQWKVNLGSMHGVKLRDDLLIYFPEQPAPQKGSVVHCSPIESIVKLPFRPPTDQVYGVDFQLQGKKISVAIKINSDTFQDFIDFEPLLKENEALLFTTTEEADYFIEIRNEQLVLLPNGSERPCFEGEQLVKENIEFTVASFLSKVEQVSRWLYIWDWKKPNTTRLQVAQEFDIHFNQYPDYLSSAQVGTPVSIDFKEKVPVVEYQFQHNEWQTPWISFSLKRKQNASYAGDLWVAVLFLDEQYSSTDKYFPVEQVSLNQKNPLFMQVAIHGFRETIFPLYVPDILLDQWGENEVVNLYKIVISTKPFTLEDFRLEALRLATRGMKGQGQARGMRNSEVGAGDYDIFNIPFIIRKPLTKGKLNSNEDLVLNEGLSISSPAGFSAEQVNIANQTEASRSTGSFEATPIAIKNTLEPFNLIADRKSDEASNVIELHDVNGIDVIGRETPLTINLGQKKKSGEAVIPLGYDPETKCFLPLGFMDSKGVINIEQLPPESPSATKGLGKSIKIYLQRLMYTKILKEKDPYPILAISEHDESGVMHYIEDKDTICKRLKGASSFLVIVHGLIGDTSDKRHITNRIKRTENGEEKDLNSKYDLTLTFDYDSLNIPIEQSAQDLLDILDDYGIDKRNGKTVHLIAHSMGGLVCRWMLEKLDGSDLVSQFVQVGSPNLGSPWASAYDYFNTALGLVINFTNGSVPLLNEILSFLGKAWDNLEVTTKQLQPDSTLVQQLSTLDFKPPIPYTIIPGDSSLIPVQQERRQTFLKKLTSGIKGTVVNVLFDEANDDIVSIRSMTAFPTGSVIITEPVACDHFGYFKTEDGIKRLGEVLWKL